MVAASRTKPNPKDFTGNQKRILAEQNREAQAAREAELSMRHQQDAQNLDVPVDYFTKNAQAAGDDDVDTPVHVEPDFANIRIACDLEKVTIGQGNVYEFKEGQVYRVPYNVARHLWNLGYVWQWL